MTYQRNKIVLPAQERFWSKVDKSAGADACWPWTGARNATGYGRVSARRHGEHEWLAHRLALRFTHGEFDLDLCVCHRCDNPTCCNPSHLFLGTLTDNNRDKVSKGRSLRGARNAFAKLTDEAVVEMRERAARGESHDALAAEYGIARKNVHSIALGLAWAHAGGPRSRRVPAPVPGDRYRFMAVAIAMALVAFSSSASAQPPDTLVLDVVQLAHHESADPFADAPGIFSVLVNGAARRGISTHAFARWHSRRFFAGQTSRPWWRQLGLDCERPRGFRGRWEEPRAEGVLSARDTCIATVALVRSLRAPTCSAVWWGSRADYSGGPHAEAHARDVFVTCSMGGVLHATCSREARDDRPRALADLLPHRPARAALRGGRRARGTGGGVVTAREDIASLTLSDMLPGALPPTWRALPRPPGILSIAGSRWWQAGPLVVCVSLDHTASEGVWLHTSVSCSGGKRLPTWAELASIKDVIHEDRLVVQILPPRAQYVNVAEVLHLWERIDAPTLPPGIARPS